MRHGGTWAPARRQHHPHPNAHSQHMHLLHTGAHHAGPGRPGHASQAQALHQPLLPRSTGPTSGSLDSRACLARSSSSGRPAAAALWPRWLSAQAGGANAAAGPPRALASFWRRSGGAAPLLPRPRLGAPAAAPQGHQGRAREAREEEEDDGRVLGLPDGEEEEALQQGLSRSESLHSSGTPAGSVEDVALQQAAERELHRRLSTRLHLSAAAQAVMRWGRADPLAAPLLPAVDSAADLEEQPLQQPLARPR